MRFIMDQFSGENLDSLAVRIGMLSEEERLQTGVRLFDPRFAQMSPPISAEVILAIQVMRQVGLL